MPVSTLDISPYFLLMFSSRHGKLLIPPLRDKTRSVVEYHQVRGGRPTDIEPY
jgi:hypothetical protein